MKKIRTLTSVLSLILAGALHAQTTTESTVSIQLRVHLNELTHGSGVHDVTTYSTRTIKTKDIIADIGQKLERPVSSAARIIRRDVMNGPVFLSTNYYLRDLNVEDEDITEHFFNQVHFTSESYVINDLRQTGSRNLIEDVITSIIGNTNTYSLPGTSRSIEKLIPIKGQSSGYYKLTGRTINVAGHFNSPLLENSGICIGTIKEQGAKVVPAVTPQ